ncbi:PEP-CTERM sorting domain-containing protein [Lusitaniella coriacea]|uniref:PEP-CTERM sorting domain-containing protein n=1 Tax=Lusitaniella coriacea TaxID=1983105 RepID=UPI003CF23A69
MVTLSSILKQTSIASVGAITLAFGTMGESVKAAKFFDRVIDFAPGRGSGIGVTSGSPYRGLNGPGTYDPSVVTALDGVNLGLGGAETQPGSIILGFSDGSSLIDGDGVDLKLYDSFGVSEGFTLEVGNDGSNWFSAGTFGGYSSSTVTQEPFLSWKTYVTGVDIASAGLTSAKFIRITAAPFSIPSFPEAYDLDAVEALNYAFIPENGSDSGNLNGEESGDSSSGGDNGSDGNGTEGDSSSGGDNSSDDNGTEGDSSSGGDNGSNGNGTEGDSSSGGDNGSDGNTDWETPSNETSVPEPTSILGLFALGIFGIGANRKRS